MNRLQMAKSLLAVALKQGNALLIDYAMLRYKHAMDAYGQSEREKREFYLHADAACLARHSYLWDHACSVNKRKDKKS